MNAGIVVGAAAAALLYGGTALAGAQEDCPVGHEQASREQLEPIEEEVLIIETEPREEGIGGAGRQAGALAPPAEQRQAQRPQADMRGLTVTLGGGLEGYTGALAPQINPGPAYGVTAAFRPLPILGIELGYSGAVNNVDDEALRAESGPDFVRNGGQAAVTLGLAPTPVQPYVLGGVGFSNYNYRGAAGGGFSDDTVGSVPVGVGLRSHMGHFTVDLRANYSFLFDQDFATATGDFNENGRYTGTLNIGGTF